MNPSPYLTTLTPLRGIAAVLVVVFHCDLMLKAFMPPEVTRLVSMGWLWVDFFFVLSGFIMCYVYRKNFKEGVAGKVYWKYIGARFARVYPLHLVTLIPAFILAVIIRAAAAKLDPFFDAMFSLWGLPTSLLMLQGMHFHVTAPLNTPSWSLSTEWWMYMIFPFLVPFTTGLKWTGKVILLLVITAAFVFVMYFLGPRAQPFPGGPPTLDIVSDFGFFRCAAGFLLGILLFDVYDSKLALNFFSKDAVFVLIFLLIVLEMHLAVHVLIIVATFPLLLLAAAYNQTRVKKFLDTSPLQRLGDWSFSIYMVHIPIIFVFWIMEVRRNPLYFSDLMTLVTAKPDYPLGWQYLAIVLPLTIVLAALTYRFVEIPARGYLNRGFGGSGKTRSD